MHVCAYVDYMYVCICVHVFVCVCVFLCVSVFVCAYVCIMSMYDNKL